MGGRCGEPRCENRGSFFRRDRDDPAFSSRPGVAARAVFSPRGRRACSSASGTINHLTMLAQAAELFAEGLTVRQAATTLHISKSEAGRLRLMALEDGLLSADKGIRLNDAPTVQ